MNREWITHHSSWLDRDMNILVHGHAGTPLIAFPCQDGKCDNWEGFQMQETLADYIENGEIQLFTVDTIDLESWSDVNGDPGWRAWMQERYFHYITEEAVPLIREKNGGWQAPIVVGFSLGATHAAITFLRRPDLFSGVLGCSGCYDTAYFWNGWSNETLYDNSPIQFLANMPEDHPYIGLYNERRIAFCVGQGAWEDEGRRTTDLLRSAMDSKGIRSRVDFWGYDVNHDWPWWRKQIRYFLPWLMYKE